MFTYEKRGEYKMALSKRAYDYDFYESGNAARKREYEYTEKVEKEKRYTKVKKTENVNNKASAIFTVLGVFAMTMIIVYRYGIINEKNLNAQQLKKELVSTEAAISTAKINVEQNTDLNKIETYAKQQLGMQKPDKNQTIYIDTSNSNTSVQVPEGKSFFQGVFDGIKNFVNKIF